MRIQPDGGLRRTMPLLVLTILSCNGSQNLNQETKDCDPPVAVAGEDQSLSLGALAILDGSTSTDCDTDGDGVAELSYAWSIESVPVGSTIDDTRIVPNSDDPAKATLQPDIAGTYVVSLLVSDAEEQLSEPDIIIITVASTNSAPVADCGGNQAGAQGVRVDMDGSASFDPEGSALSYNWTLSSAPTCSALITDSVYNGQSPTAAIVPDCEGVFVVGLVVSDGDAWSPPSFCSINVAGTNQVPVADAGVNTTLSPCSSSTAELNGFGSYDPEGSALTWRWSVLSVPRGSAVTDTSLSNTSIANPTFRWDVPGDYTFQLQVTDGTGWSSPDVVILSFQDERDNHPPQANAGADVSISTSTDCTTASYVVTCEDCPEEDVDVDGSASIDAQDGDELDFTWRDPSGELIIASPTAPITTVTLPSAPSSLTANVRSWQLELTVEDCADDDTDQTTITYTCTGAVN